MVHTAAGGTSRCVGGGASALSQLSCCHGTDAGHARVEGRVPSRLHVQLAAARRRNPCFPFVARSPVPPTAAPPPWRAALPRSGSSSSTSMVQTWTPRVRRHMAARSLTAARCGWVRGLAGPRHSLVLRSPRPSLLLLLRRPRVAVLVAGEAGSGHHRPQRPAAGADSARWRLPAELVLAPRRRRLELVLWSHAVW